MPYQNRFVHVDASIQILNIRFLFFFFFFCRSINWVQAPGDDPHYHRLRGINHEHDYSQEIRPQAACGAMGDLQAPQESGRLNTRVPDPASLQWHTWGLRPSRHKEPWLQGQSTGKKRGGDERCLAKVGRGLWGSGLPVLTPIHLIISYLHPLGHLLISTSITTSLEVMLFYWLSRLWAVEQCWHFTVTLSIGLVWFCRDQQIP